VGDKAKEQPTTLPLLAEAPATRPAQELSSSAAGAAAPEMERADRGAAPTTAPAADLNLGVAAQVLNEPATTQQMPLADEQQRVDVVIVLQDDEAIDPALGRALDPSAGPMPAPETQPVAPPAEPTVAPQQQTEQLPAAEPPVVDSPAPTQPPQQPSPQP
jgi:hypothetical protein